MPRELQPDDPNKLKSLRSIREGRKYVRGGKRIAWNACPHSKGLHIACELSLPDQLNMHACRSGARYGLGSYGALRARLLTGNE